uniref:Uncharacterized protein n=1 Tax=Syphacia muris TaxID=451379 RepID=A0A0N5AW36_9BILA
MGYLTRYLVSVELTIFSPLEDARLDRSIHLSRTTDHSNEMEETDETDLPTVSRLTVIGPRLSSSACEVRLEKNLENTYGLSRLRYCEAIDSTHSLSYLSWVHARQLRRMETRSEWFLAPVKADSPSITDLKFASATFSRRSGTGGSTRDNFQHNEDRSDIDDCATNSLELKGKGSIKRKRSWRKHYVRPNRSLDDEGQNTDPSLMVAVVIRRRSMGASMEEAMYYKALAEANGSNSRGKGHLKLGRCQSNVETNWMRPKC